MVRRRSRRRAFGGGLLVTGSLVMCGWSAPALAATSCASIVPQASAGVRRAITADDLARVRDIGMPADSLPGKSPVTISPDGRRVAFQLRQADPATNSYCQALFVLDLRAGSSPMLVDGGGELITYVFQDLRGVVYTSGIPDVVVPAWSPDGRWIAYRKRIDGRTQAWLVRADGGDAHVVIDRPEDVEAVGWSADGKSLLFASRPGLLRAERDIDLEGRSGYLFGARSVPIARARPFPASPINRMVFALDLDTRAVRLATSAEQARLDDTPPDRPQQADLYASGAKGARAWSQAHDAAFTQSPSDIWAAVGQRPPVRCPDPSCSGTIEDLWWSRDTPELRFLHREGWGKSMTALYRWRPGERRVRRVMETSDVLTDCQPTRDDRLLCDRDQSLRPRHIVLIDPRSGRTQVVFDPNPEFASLSLGSVQRLHWRNDHGVESYGDLVLPPDHRPGDRHPLIVVQYRTRGFLRGGVGDEYPIQAFAARGYAVLSFERPPFPAEADAKPNDRRTLTELQRDDTIGWVDRRNMLSSLLEGVALTIKLGVVDPDRIGITGLSDGAVSAWFALNNSSIFKAAAISSCCMDPKTLLLLGGPTWTQHMEREGYPSPSIDDPGFWKPESLAMNADHVTAPILMQQSDDEYLLALEAYAALDERNRAVEMRIFPGEHHVKWQPAHRLAIYQRNLDWFDFWLRGIEEPDPAKRDQYAHWEAMRTRLHTPLSQTASVGDTSIAAH